MRIISGIARGRRLKAPTGRNIRPTADRVRESIFNLLGPGSFQGLVLDLFSGTGALGIEALSRGAQQAVFVEKDHRAASLIRENLALCGFEERARLLIKNVRGFLEEVDHQAPFSLVLMDPPYGQGLIEVSLALLTAQEWLQEGARVICESEVGLVLPENIGALTLQKKRRYGQILVHMFER